MIQGETHYKGLHQKEKKRADLLLNALRNTQEELRKKNKIVRKIKIKINRLPQDLLEDL